MRLAFNVISITKKNLTSKNSKRFVFTVSADMSAKSKTAMETEAETQANVRPTRNLKPVVYAERKRVQPVKEITAEPDDKKKKKVNGKSNADAPSKKIGRKKADTNGEKTSDQEEKGEDELMTESRNKKDELKPIAEEVVSNSKKLSRKKKVEETVVDIVEEAPGEEPKVQKDSKTTSRKKAKDTVEATNGEGSSKPTESKAAVSKTTKGKKATSPSTATADDAEVKSDNQDEVTTKSVTSKPSKTAKGKKAVKESNDAVDPVDDGEVVDEGSNNKAKPGRKKKTAAKGNA